MTAPASVRILHPGIEPAQGARSDPAPSARDAQRRPRQLAGMRLALIDNSKPNARELLLEVTRLLQRNAPGMVTQMWRKQTSAQPAPFLKELTEWRADAVLNGIGD